MQKYDEVILKHTLENNFVCYLHKNNYFNHLITMALTVKVGSLYETKNENGLAHLLEHMHMNFRKQNLYPGLKYKSTANTDFYETIFYIKCYSEQSSIYTCLEILFNIANGNFLKEEYFNATKKDVIIEILDSNRLKIETNKEIALLLNGSHYIEAMPIGQMDIVKNLKYADVLKFFKKWYSADIMSLSVVGDIKDLNNIKNNINTLFDRLECTKRDSVDINFEIPQYKYNYYYKIEIDQPNILIWKIYFKFDKRTQRKTRANNIIPEILEYICFDVLENIVCNYFHDHNIDIGKVTCDKINFNSDYDFYFVMLSPNDFVQNIYDDKIYHLLVHLFNSELSVDRELVLTIIQKYKMYFEKTKDDFYHDVDIQIFLQDSINNFIYAKPLYKYTDKILMFIESFKEIKYEVISSYLEQIFLNSDKLIVLNLSKC